MTGAAEGLVGTAKGAFETVSGIPGQAFESLKACNPFADLNTPPVATIFGGGTTPTDANLIVNNEGRVIAVDLEGSDVQNRTFTSVPSVNVAGKVGRKGGGAALTVIMQEGDGRYGFDNLKTKPRPIEKIIVLEPGKDFLPAPDGSVGGAYGTFAEKDNTIIRSVSGNHQKFPPGREVTTPPEAIIFIPNGGNVVFPDGTVDQQGNFADGLQNGRGLTDGNGFIVPEEYTFRTPTPEDVGVDIDGLTFPVILELDDIAIRKSGVSFNNGDTITISGGGLLNDQTITLEPILSTEGSILGVRIPEDQRGQGFTDIPDLTINTQTGAGALLTPLLRVKYRGRDSINEVIDSVTQEQIVTVVDCVGARPVGFVDGEPYYGPFHVHNGRKMVGERHTSAPHSFIEDAPARESTRRSTRRTRRAPTQSTPTSGGGGGGLPVASTPASSTTPSPSPTPSPAPAPSPTPTPAPSPSPSPSPGGGGYGGGY